VPRAGLLLVCLGCAEPPPAPAAPEAAGPLAATHDDLCRRIGGHRMLAHSRIGMSDGRELIEDWTLLADGRGNFRLEHTNNQELGKEAVFLDGVLYTRHRFGTFLDRGAERGEAKKLRDEAWGVLGAYLDLLQPWLEVRREDDRLRLKKAARRKAGPRDTDRPERRWRDTVVARSLEGWVLLDGDVPTDAELHARYSFTKDGKTGTAEMDYTRYLTRGSPELEKPDAIPTPVLRRIEPDRQRLLGNGSTSR
jgi:hypothetical protein